MSGGAMDYAYTGVDNARWTLERVAAEVYAKEGDAVDAEPDPAAREKEKARLATLGEMTGELAELLRTIEWCWSGDRGFAEWGAEYEAFMRKWAAGRMPGPAALVVPQARRTTLGSLSPGTLIRSESFARWLIATGPEGAERASGVAHLRRETPLAITLESAAPESEVLAIDGRARIALDLAHTRDWGAWGWQEWGSLPREIAAALGPNGWRVLAECADDDDLHWIDCTSGAWVRGWTPAAGETTYAIRHIDVRLEGASGEAA